MAAPVEPLGRSNPKVLAAALRLFAEQGYHGTSIRQIAAGAGLSVPGVYHHYASKQDVLADLMDTVLRELLARTRAALDGTDDPAAAFDALVGELLRFHVERREEAFVASTELRSLTEANRERVVGLRDEQERMLDDVVAAGVAAGVFATPYAHDAARSVAVLCVGVATWYRPGGDPVDELVERQLRLCRDLVGG